MRHLQTFRRAAALVAFALLAVTTVSTTSCAARLERPLEGFGASTPGGDGGAAYVVTSLADSGPGTLRDAVSAPNRTVSFAVGGTIRLATSLCISGHHLTIDGSSAPSPGITITAASPSVAGALLDLRGCHDVIVRHVRVCDAPDLSAGDNVRIWDGAYNVVIDHCSVRRAGDGNLDISDGAHDVTVQWCILAETVKNSLIRTGVSNVSLHHNLFVHGDERDPQLDDAAPVDMVNNVVYDWSGNYGTRIRNLASANVVANSYIPGPRSDASDALVIMEDAGPVYLEGNSLPPSCVVSGTSATRLPAPTVTEMSTGDALRAVLDECGAFPRDPDDAEYVSSVSASSVETAFSWSGIKAMFR